MQVDKRKQVWCAGTLFVPVKHGFLYFVAIKDSATWKLGNWQLSHPIHLKNAANLFEKEEPL